MRKVAEQVMRSANCTARVVVAHPQKENCHMLGQKHRVLKYSHSAKGVLCFALTVHFSLNLISLPGGWFVGWHSKCSKISTYGFVG